MLSQLLLSVLFNVCGRDRNESETNCSMSKRLHKVRAACECAMCEGDVTNSSTIAICAHVILLLCIIAYITTQ